MVSEYAFKTQWWKRLVLRLNELDRAKAKGRAVQGITLDDLSEWSSRALPPSSRVADAVGLLAGFTKGLLTQNDRLSNRMWELEDKERLYTEEIHNLKQDMAPCQLAIGEMQKQKPLRSWIMDAW